MQKHWSSPGQKEQTDWLVDHRLSAEPLKKLSEVGAYGLSLSVPVKCVRACLQAGGWCTVELTKAFPLWWVRLIIILMASQSDANSSNGKARAGGWGAVGVLREEKEERWK